MTATEYECAPGAQTSETENQTSAILAKYARAIQLHAQGHSNQALALLSECVLAAESDAELWVDWAALVLAARRDTHLAEQALRRAMVLAPNRFRAPASLGGLLVSLGRVPEAIPYLQRSLDILDRGAGRRPAAGFAGPGPVRVAAHQQARLAVLQKLPEEASRIKWYHRIDLGGGVITRGSGRFEAGLTNLHIPETLEGWSVLDIGAWDGAMAFEAERRGARRVLATDGFAWKGRMPHASKAGFDLACLALGSRVESRIAGLAEMSPEEIGRFDLVFLLDPVYDLRDPLADLRKVFAFTGKLLILRTPVDLSGVERPALAFHPHREFAQGPSNWWTPNPSGVLAMLKSVGFRHSQVVAAGSPENEDLLLCGHRPSIVVHATP